MVVKNSFITFLTMETLRSKQLFRMIFMSKPKKESIPEEWTIISVAAVIGYSLATIPHDDILSTLLVLAGLIIINTVIWRILGLDITYKREPRIRKWKLVQKCKLGLFIFLLITMFGGSFENGGFIIVLLGSLYLTLPKVWRNSYRSTIPNKRTRKKSQRFLGMDEIDRMSGTEFELLIAKLYDAFGYFTEVTPPSGDFGADVLTVKNKTKTAIQAKCYGEGRAIGVEAVNEVVGGAGYWNATRKIVITNQYFTNAAIESAKRNDVILVNRDGLQVLLKKYRNALETKQNDRLLSFFKRKIKFKLR